jgi:hypothetical protein
MAAPALTMMKLEPGSEVGSAGSAAAIPVDRNTEYVRLFSAVFSRQQFEQLHGHYYKVRAIAEGRGEHSTRSGRERRTERRFKPYTMIERAPPGAKELLDKHIGDGEDEQALKIMRALRYFEKYPRFHGGGGPVAPWASCLVDSAVEWHGVVDLSHDEVDVEAFIIDALVVKVIKAEPEAGLDPAVKAETPESTPDKFEGTKVRKKFPSYGWYDGEVIGLDDGGSGGGSAVYQVQWHDGSGTDMTVADVLKYAKVWQLQYGSNSARGQGTVGATNRAVGSEPAEKAGAAATGKQPRVLLDDAAGGSQRRGNDSAKARSPGQPARKRVKTQRRVSGHGGLADAGAGLAEKQVAPEKAASTAAKAALAAVQAVQGAAELTAKEKAQRRSAHVRGRLWAAPGGGGGAGAEASAGTGESATGESTTTEDQVEDGAAGAEVEPGAEAPAAAVVAEGESHVQTEALDDGWWRAWCVGGGGEEFGLECPPFESGCHEWFVDVEDVGDGCAIGVADERKQVHVLGCNGSFLSEGDWQDLGMGLYATGARVAVRLELNETEVELSFFSAPDADTEMVSLGAVSLGEGGGAAFTPVFCMWPGSILAGSTPLEPEPEPD